MLVSSLFQTTPFFQIIQLWFLLKVFIVTLNAKLAIMWSLSAIITDIDP